MASKKSNGRGVFFGLALIGILLVAIGLQALVQKFIVRPEFLVREIEIHWVGEQDPGPARFRLSPPTSIFLLDLNALQKAFQQRYPISEVRKVERQFPDKIVATMRKRRVVAQVYCGGLYYPVSDDALIVARGSRAPYDRLTILSSDGFNASSFQPGDPLGMDDFWKASELLVTLRRGEGLANHAVTRIRLTGTDIFVSLDTGVEVRFSKDHLKDGWHRLAGVLSQRRNVLTEAKYLDLRFEDPVIGENPETLKQKKKAIAQKKAA